MTAESTLVFLYKLLRPKTMFLAVGTTVVAAYAASLRLTAPVWWNALGAAFFFTGIACWHAGVAARMHAVKQSRRLIIRRQFLCIACGLAAYLVTLVIANTFLPNLNHTLYAVDAAIIGFYAPVFCKHWALKNPSIAGACTLPILVGWSASGQPYTRETFFFCAILFSVIAAREAVKDVEDVGADKSVVDLYSDGGSRRTLATEFGVVTANRVAACWCIITALLMLLWQYSARSTMPMALLVAALLPAAWLLFLGTRLVRSAVDAGAASARLLHVVAAFGIVVVAQRAIAAF